MVSLSIDFYGARDSIQTEVLRRLESIDVSGQPFDGAWLLYGMSALGLKEENVFATTLNALGKWSATRAAGTRERDLAPLCLCHFLSQEAGVKTHTVQKVREILNGALKTLGRKFNVLNDPDQLFFVSLLNSVLDSKTKESLVEFAKKSATGRVSRKVLFRAALVELGNSIQQGEIEGLDPGSDPDDVVSVLWIVKRYTPHGVLALWQKVETLLPTFRLGAGPEECRLSNRTLALLGEAVSRETREPDPKMIFDLFPFDQEIRNIARDHFRQGKYVSAVFEATKKLNEFIQKASGSQKSEAELVQSSMQFRGDKAPIVQFNEYLKETSGKNEQNGLAMIAEGIFKAFRNPKGHKPEDHPFLGMKGCEALSQLIAIDYILKRVRNAKTPRTKS